MEFPFEDDLKRRLSKLELENDLTPVLNWINRHKFVGMAPNHPWEYLVKYEDRLVKLDATNCAKAKLTFILTPPSTADIGNGVGEKVIINF